MIECFATWCPPCRNAIPHVAEWAHKYKNVYIISVSDESKEEVQGFMDEEMECMKTYNVALGNLDELMTKNNVRGIPHAFIFDKDNKMLWHGHPMSPECEKLLQQYNM
jgi:thiol-disulfide isomerase/thioredoxin